MKKWIDKNELGKFGINKQELDDLLKRDVDVKDMTENEKGIVKDVL